MNSRKNFKLHNAEQAKLVYQYKNTKIKLYKNNAAKILLLNKELYIKVGVRSQPVYCADVYRERRYQMLCEYNLSSWRWAC
jgi:hypothetical protein